MKVPLESTSKIITLNSAPARLWEGTTESGVPVVAFISRIAVPSGQPQGEFEKELQEHRPPRPELAGTFDARLIL